MVYSKYYHSICLERKDKKEDRKEEERNKGSKDRKEE
jgi:hypothetical protein